MKVALIDNRGVPDITTISSSVDLTSELLGRAASSSTELRLLMARLAEVAGPEQGWAKLLKVVAKIAASDWLEGELQVDFDAVDGGQTSIAFYSVFGVGIRERLFSAYTLNVPIDEFQRAVLIAPDAISPLRAHQGRGKLSLAMGMRVRNKDIPDFELEEKAKGDGERPTAPPPATRMSTTCPAAPVSLPMAAPAEFDAPVLGPTGRLRNAAP